MTTVAPECAVQYPVGWLCRVRPPSRGLRQRRGWLRTANAFTETAGQQTSS